MIKSTLAAAALATALVATPLATANAHGFDIVIDLGAGDWGASHGMSCWEARHALEDEFDHVWKIECSGSVYTFKVKDDGDSSEIVKINKYTGNYWEV